MMLLQARRMRTVRIVGSEIESGFGSHKRRAALNKKVKVAKELICGHG
jgi:hypothetical protein